MKNGYRNQNAVFHPLMRILVKVMYLLNRYGVRHLRLYSHITTARRLHTGCTTTVLAVRENVARVLRCACDNACMNGGMEGMKFTLLG